MTSLLMAILFFSSSTWAHVPALLPPLMGTPISSYFLGQSDVSRAVYSELTNPGDFFVVQFQVKKGAGGTKAQLLVPVCPQIPGYEGFQPSGLLLKGDLPWKMQGESNAAFVERLKAKAVAQIASDFPAGSRPKFFEEFGKQYYWVGGEWAGRLAPGLYAIVVYDSKGGKGTFTLGLNEKEAWNPDLFEYAGRAVKEIAAGICSPNGFTGRLNLSPGSLVKF